MIRRLAQFLFMASVTAIVFPLVVLSLFIVAPPKRWADPRYRW